MKLSLADRNALVLNNVKLVYLIMNRVWNPGTCDKNCFLSRDDMTQEGMKALICAANNYDPERGVQFSTYAVHAIKNAYGDMFYRGLIKLPMSKNLSDRNLKRFTSYSRHARRIGYINMPTYADRTEDHRFDHTSLSDLIDLRHLLSECSWQEQWLIRKRFFSEWKMRELGEYWGLNKETMRKYLVALLDRMQDSLTRTKK